MCAIAGQIDCGGHVTTQDEIFTAMLDTMSRRGPNQNGIYKSGGATLLHARLSVIDIENGIQPMTFSRGAEEYTIVYNGELYNTEEVRKDLAAAGHHFKSYSDTEVLLHSYVEWKDRCVDHLNGIFAFAIWEKHAKRLFTARDRMGVKPFFYYHKDGCFLFASEIKTILCHPMAKPRINAEGLAEIMLIGPGRTPGCGVFLDIKELLPGEYGYLFPELDRYERHIYWSLEDQEHTDTFEQTVEKVRFLVTDSIKRQLVSDVPVCTFLSGGLDSSIISSIANQQFAALGKQLFTVSVDYADNAKYFKPNKFQPNSDASYIQIMNRYLGVENHLITINTPELVSALFEAVDARDLPGMADVDSSLLLFCGEIKKIATVGLSGECADEIFGGYPWYRDKEIREKFGFPWAQSTGYRSSFLKKGMLGDIDPFEYVNSKYSDTLAESSILKQNTPLEARMKQMVNLNHKWFMQTLLDRKDRMSMYSGLEVRVPFCDYRIAEYLYTVPWEYKDYQGYEKGLLRQAMRGILPDEVLWRKKSPYPKTFHPSYLKAVSDLLTQVINDPSSPILDYVNKDAMAGLLHSNNTVPWYGQLMTTPQTIAYLLQFNYWLKKFKVQMVN